jgi:hypothetical protein
VFPRLRLDPECSRAPEFWCCAYEQGALVPEMRREQRGHHSIFGMNETVCMVCHTSVDKALDGLDQGREFINIPSRVLP